MTVDDLVEMASSSRGLLSLQFVDETGNVETDDDHFDALPSRKRRLPGGPGGWDGGDESGGGESDDDCCIALSSTGTASGTTAEKPRPGKKTRGRVKIRMAYINDKVRRYTTFSKRKTGIMKKAYELAVLTGTQVMLLVASETGHVYTFATKKLQPVIMSENGKALIQTCLNSPDAPPSPHAKEISTSGQNDERMNPLGFEEPNLMYGAGDEKNNSSDQSKSNDTMNKPVSAENPIQIASLPVIETTLDQSTVLKPPAVVSQTPNSLLQPSITTVGNYTAAAAALKEAKVGVVPENVAAVGQQTASTHEVTSQSQQFYYRIDGSNQLISIPGGANSTGLLMYPGQPTVVLPVQGSATRSLFSEGYLLNIANAPDLAVAADGNVSQPIFTLPFTMSNSQISQTDQTASGLTASLIGFVNGQKKTAQHK